MMVLIITNIINWISPIISILAFVFSLLSFYKSNALAKGQLEMQIHEMITSAKTRYGDLGLQLKKDQQNTILAASVMAALEDVLNAYDQACAKYIDKKTDKERFKKSYVNEIRHLVENDNTKKYYIGPQTKYRATVKVYNEWNNLE